jgi:hypothetical protein
MPWGNSVRILIDAICTIEGPDEDAPQRFVLIAPCRKEWMYRDDTLIQMPNGEYRVIFGQDRQLFVGKDMLEHGDREPSTPADVFSSLDIDIVYAEGQELLTDRDVIAVSQQSEPIVARTRIEDAESGYRSTLEYPVRTLNIHPERGRFQVDTGPLIVPDSTIDAEHLIDRCRLAHTVWNAWDWAEFILKRPTAIDPGEPSGPRVFHYADLRHLEVQNTLIVIKER